MCHSDIGSKESDMQMLLLLLLLLLMMMMTTLCSLVLTAWRGLLK